MSSRPVDHVERESRAPRVTRLRVTAITFAVLFYVPIGFKKSSGVLPGCSFDGTNFTYQPMKKQLMKWAAGSLQLQ